MECSEAELTKFSVVCMVSAGACGRLPHGFGQLFHGSDLSRPAIAIRVCSAPSLCPLGALPSSRASAGKKGVPNWESHATALSLRCVQGFFNPRRGSLMDCPPQTQTLRF